MLDIINKVSRPLAEIYDYYIIIERKIRVDISVSIIINMR
jgi:hypothetical protein